MELHKRFINIALKEPSIFEIVGCTPLLNDSIDSVITKFIDDGFERLKITNATSKDFELLRLLLCQQYKLNYECIIQTKSMLHSRFDKLIEILTIGELVSDNANQSILLDVIVLQLVLFEDQKNYIRLFEDFRSISTSQSESNKLSTVWYLKLLRCFLMAWEILYFLSNEKESGVINRTHLESCKKVLLSSVIYDITTWIKCKDNNEYCALYSVLSKIVNVAKSTKILSPYINEIIDNHENLTSICALCDFAFPTKFPSIDVDYNLIYQRKLWETIQYQLSSSQSQERKQALYLFKRLIEFITMNKQEVKKVASLSMAPSAINPFICLRTNEDQLTLEQLTTNFILVMEALEEKQKHLVIPTLPLVDTLIQGLKTHQSCGNCFDIRWIYCTFARLLAHDNNAVVKWGLLKSLKLSADAYKSDDFIQLILKSLNNTFLYEKCNDESKPEIVLAMTDWFNNFQSEHFHLIEKFLYHLQEVSWGPIAIYYILQSIVSVSDELEDVVNFQQEQLDIIQVIMERNIKLHPPMLRSMSQVMIMKILSRFCKIQNLYVLSNFLSNFSENDLEECGKFTLMSWLVKLPYSAVVQFVNQISVTLTFNDNDIKIPMSLFSLIIHYLYEGKVICQNESCSVANELRTLFSNLDRVDVRPYVKISFIVKIIDLLYCLFDSGKPPEFVYNLFIQYQETIFGFVSRLFYIDDFQYEHVAICTKILQTVKYCKISKLNNLSIITNNNYKELESKCIQVISNPDKHSTVQILFAVQSWSHIFNYLKYDDVFFFNKINYLLKNYSVKYSSKLKGKLGSDYYLALSKLIRDHIVTLSTDELEKSDHWFHILSYIHDAAGNKVLIYFGDIMHSYSSAVVNDNKKLEDFKCLIKCFWNCNFASKREKTFWLVVQKLTECINSSTFSNCSVLQEISQEFTDRMLNESESLPGLKYILLCCSEINSNFYHFTRVILSGLLHGQVMRRDQRIFMQTCMAGREIVGSYFLKNGEIENFEAYDFINRVENVDVMIRATAVLQLCKALNTDCKNASLFLPLLLENLSVVQNKRYFADSQLHRLKHRIMQVLLILQPYLDKVQIETISQQKVNVTGFLFLSIHYSQESTQILYCTLRDSILRDSDQHSVRLMKEWILIRIFLLNGDLMPDLWLLFDKIINERPGSASSIIGIVWHIAQQLLRENLSKFVETALTKLGVCCMGQQFGMRLFGQVFYTKIYELLEEENDLKSKYTSFYDTIIESLRCGNLKKNPIKVDEDFFYAVFNPMKDYDLETIYHQMPRLSNVSIEEWITLNHFKGLLSLNRDNNLSYRMNFENHSQLLHKANIPYSILKSSENSKSEGVDCVEVATDLQKKIVPWKTMLPTEDFSELADFTDIKYEAKYKQDIIIVASLVEKSQNLGGIARTCEIFGVKELVISNLKQIEDKEFQVLSVSADRWITISEVKLFSLTNYLLEMKESGWTLVGAEQTANSVSLTNFNFPKQTALILGNEKNGIPPSIIPLLDICVEIPQLGVIRSLNVHVTSAICIWEYVKQNQSITL